MPPLPRRARAYARQIHDDDNNNVYSRSSRLHWSWSWLSSASCFGRPAARGRLALAAAAAGVLNAITIIRAQPVAFHVGNSNTGAAAASSHAAVAATETLAAVGGGYTWSATPSSRPGQVNWITFTVSSRLTRRAPARINSQSSLQRASEHLFAAAGARSPHASCIPPCRAPPGGQTCQSQHLAAHANR